MEKHYVPKYLNAKPQLLWWELDQFMILMVFTGLGVMANKQFEGAAIGFILMFLYTKITNSNQPGFIKHFSYKYGMWGAKGRVVEYYIKELMR